MGKYLITSKESRERGGVERTFVQPVKVHNSKEKKKKVTAALFFLWGLYPHTVHFQAISYYFIYSSAF